MNWHTILDRWRKLSAPLDEIEEEFAKSPNFSNLFFLVRWSVTYNRWIYQKGWKHRVTEGVINASLAIAAAFLQQWAVKHWDFLMTITGHGRIPIVLTLIGLAVVLVWTKQYFQSAYGTLELVFATVSSWQILGSQTPNRFTQSLALIGALYVMTRGITNVLEGRAKRSARRQPPVAPGTPAVEHASHEWTGE